jgi:hypothetical protein
MGVDVTCNIGNCFIQQVLVFLCKVVNLHQRKHLPDCLICFLDSFFFLVLEDGTPSSCFPSFFGSSSGSKSSSESISTTASGVAEAAGRFLRVLPEGVSKVLEAVVEAEEEDSGLASVVLATGVRGDSTGAEVTGTATFVGSAL